MIVDSSTLILRMFLRTADIANTTERIKAAKAMIEETASLEKKARKYSNIESPLIFKYYHRVTERARKE